MSVSEVEVRVRVLGAWVVFTNMNTNMYAMKRHFVWQLSQELGLTPVSLGPCEFHSHVWKFFDKKTKLDKYFTHVKTFCSAHTKHLLCCNAIQCNTLKYKYQYYYSGIIPA